jgi:membrane protein YdbS with pleckstrin-like domain
MEPYQNPEMKIFELPDYQKVEFQPIHPKYWRIILCNVLFVFLLLGGVLVLIWSQQKSAPAMSWWICGGVWLGLLLFQLIIRYYAFQRRGYALREKDVIYRHGVLSVATTVIPFCRIQHVALKEGFLSRMMHLAQLQIFTAGGATSDLKVSGIPKDEAERMRAFMMQQLIAHEDGQEALGDKPQHNEANDEDA